MDSDKDWVDLIDAATSNHSLIYMVDSAEMVPTTQVSSKRFYSPFPPSVKLKESQKRTKITTNNEHRDDD